MNKTARAIAYLFHPTIIPTLGFLLLFHSDFYFSMLGWQAKRLVLLIIFFTTCILPLLSIALLSINPKFKLSPDSENFRALSLIFTAFSYYLGYLLLLRIEALPVFKLLQLASIFGDSCAPPAFIQMENQQPHGCTWCIDRCSYCTLFQDGSQSDVVNCGSCFYLRNSCFCTAYS